MLEFAPNQKILVYKVPNSENKFEAHILAKVNKTLIITRPQILKGKTILYLSDLDPNSMLYGEYEFDGKKFYFRTKIIKSHYTPFPHTILLEPEGRNLKIIPLRKAERYRTLLPILILYKEQEKTIKFPESFALDFSKNGIGLICPIEIPEIFDIDFMVFGEVIELKCEKKVFIKNKYKKFHFIGAEILNITNEKYFERLIEYLKILNEFLKPF